MVSIEKTETYNIEIKPLSLYSLKELMNEIMTRKGWTNKTAWIEFKKIFKEIK